MSFTHGKIVQKDICLKPAYKDSHSSFSRRNLADIGLCHGRLFQIGKLQSSGKFRCIVGLYGCDVGHIIHALYLGPVSYFGPLYDRKNFNHDY